MTNNTDIYKLAFAVESKELDQAIKKFQKFKKSLNFGPKAVNFDQLAKDAVVMNRQIDTMNVNLKKTQIQTSRIGRIWEQSKNGVFGFNGALLSTLFFGMEMQRIFGGALKGIFEGYKKIIPESHMFNIETTRLAANWEFFKFQLADALSNSPLFKILIGLTINLIKWFQGLSEETKTFIVISLGILTVIGAFMLYVSIIGLGIAGLGDLAIAAQGVGSVFGAISTPLLLVASLLLILGSSILFATNESETMNSAYEDLAESFKLFGDVILDLVNTILSPFNIELLSVGEAMIWVAGLTQMFLSGVLSLGTGLVGLTNFLVVGLGGALITIGAVLVDVGEAAVEMWNGLRGKGFNFSGFDKSKLALEAVTESLGALAFEYGQTIDTIGKNTMSFEDINKSIDEYRQGVDSINIASEDIGLDSNLIADFLTGNNQEINNNQTIIFNEGSIQPMLSGEDAATQVNDFMKQFQDQLKNTQFQTGN